jgi:hypothetical protein
MSLPSASGWHLGPPHLLDRTSIPRSHSGMMVKPLLVVPRLVTMRMPYTPLIIKACHDYRAHIGGLNMWPKLDEQIAWAQDVWKMACAVVKEEYELTDRMLGLVSFSSKSYVHVLTPSRSINRAPVLMENSSTESSRKLQQLTGLFTVTIRRPSATTRSSALIFRKAMLFHIRFDISNLSSETLLIYVLQDVKEQTGFTQHKIISEVLHKVWFNHKTAIGVKFPDYIFQSDYIILISTIRSNFVLGSGLLACLSRLSSTRRLGRTSLKSTLAI